MAQWQAQLDSLRRDQRTPLVIAAIFIILLFLSISQLINTILDHTTKIQAAQTAASPERLINLAELHMFGVFSANLDSLPTTTLQLTLEGTVVNVDSPADSYAIIGSPNQPAKMYQVGNTLPGNATITRITKDYIVLNDNGTLEKLALPIPPLLTGK